MAAATRARSRSSRRNFQNEPTRYATPESVEPFPTFDTAVPSISRGPNSTTVGLDSVNRWSHSTSSSQSPRSKANSGEHGPISPTMTTSAGKLSRSPRAPDDRLPAYHRQFQPSLPPLTAAPEPPTKRPDATRVPGAIRYAPSATRNDTAVTTTGFGHGAMPPTPVIDDDRFVSQGPISDMIQLNAGETFFTKGRGRDQRPRAPSQKAMLSKALQKANTAVLLDNAANFEGAMEAYNDACQLLQWVMLQSNGGQEEKLKLQEIRDTYMIRVHELQRLDYSGQQSGSKALPQRPRSDDSFADGFEQGSDPGTGHSWIASQQASQSLGAMLEPSTMMPRDRIPPRHQSLLPSAFDDELQYMTPSPQSATPLDPSWHDETDAQPTSGALSPSLILHEEGTRDVETSSTSWLDTIAETGASSPSSPRSQTSSVYLRRRRSRHISTGTEAAFDAALDAAVEAAYDEGLEPVVDEDDRPDDDDDDDRIMSTVRRNVELAKQKVREAEREAEEVFMRNREIRQAQNATPLDSTGLGHFDAFDDEDEAERILDDMTDGYVMDDFEFDLQSKSALPRQSDSSSFSGRTWGSSVTSSATRAAPPLYPLAEDEVLPPQDVNLKVDVLDPVSSTTASSSMLSLEEEAIAEMPAVSLTSELPKPPTFGTSPQTSVRARRLSGQKNQGELKIDTSPQAISHTRNLSNAPLTTSELHSHQTGESPTDLLNPGAGAEGAIGAAAVPPRSSRRNPSVSSLISELAPRPRLTRAVTSDASSTGVSGMPVPGRPIGKVPSAPDNLGKSAPSLRSFQSNTNTSVSGADRPVDFPQTPGTGIFPPLDAQRSLPSGVFPGLSTPTGASFTSNGLPTGGLYLFDSTIHSPTSPGSPNPLAVNAPVPLEPCPESFLLRPFWLLRGIYQTIAHPRGGYLSTRLFVPRDVWRVKNVKLKAVEDKVSNCDLLTAALLKLAQVDTYDADATLEEMQALESVLDQVQASLTKRLGQEVGVHGATSLFKESSSPSDGSSLAAESTSSKSSSGSGKSYLSSWRKLRSKTSSGPTAGIPSSHPRDPGAKDSFTLHTLPMTSSPTSHFVRRNVTQLEFSGPNANYMASLARLCDAAQVLDQIARQVEDPGLRHSSQTLVGLELSTRHAAEFFGFYICRFVLNDISLMLDKFIKRGSEWVLI